MRVADGAVATAAVLLLSLSGLSRSGAVAAQDDPLSAIPWLSLPSEAPARRGAVETVEVGPLAGGDAVVGLVPAQLAGLAQDTWTGSEPGRLVASLGALPVHAPPALQDVARALMLAELPAPGGSAVLRARVDALVARGAVDAAGALLDLSGHDPATFQRRFDLALLAGDDDAVCAAFRADPSLLSDPAARAWCLMRGGDWAAAWLTAETGRATARLDPEAAEIAFRFLDPDLFEGAPPPDAPARMTPVLYRMLDGIGETPPSRGLGLAYATADLRPTMGWKARVEAGERLARAGTLDPNALLDLYTQGRPSASGGVWDRAAAVQALEAALASGEDVEAAARVVLERLGPNGLAVPVAKGLADGLRRAVRDGHGGDAAMRLALLSGDGAGAAAVAARAPEDPALSRAAAVARGGVPEATGDAFADAVLTGLRAPPPPRITRMIAQGRMGEALLDVVESLAEGRHADPGAVADGLATLRAAGQGEAARRLAVQLLLG